MTKTCLIGGNGFIGQALSDLLLRHDRVITSIGTTEPRLRHPAITYIKGDYGDPEILSVLNDMDEVVLLAYSSVPRTSFEDPLADVTSNLPRVLTFLKIAAAANLKKIVVVSSGGACYGKTENRPITEDHPTNPISPYGITKLAIEKYCLMYRELYDVPVVIVRPGNAYGIGQKAFTGQGFVSTAIASILDHKPITVFGDQGTVRDYVYIDDVAEGLWAALEKGHPGSVYNLGTGIGTDNLSMLAILTKLAAQIGLQPIVTTEPARSFDVPYNILDSSRLSADTGWQPTVSLDEGLEKTWEWFRSQRVSS